MPIVFLLDFTRRAQKQTSITKSVYSLSTCTLLHLLDPHSNRVQIPWAYSPDGWRGEFMMMLKLCKRFAGHSECWRRRQRPHCFTTNTNKAFALVSNFVCFGGKEFRAQHNFINILQKSYRTTLQALGLHANANVTHTICCSDSRADGL